MNGNVRQEPPAFKRGEDVRKKEEKPKKIHATFLIVIPIPHSLFSTMTPEDKHWFEDLTRNHVVWQGDNAAKYVFNLEDIYKLRSRLGKYKHQIAYPDSAILRKYGLKHSAGDSIDIRREGDAFVVEQYWPDGDTHTYIVPQSRVWTVNSIIEDYFRTFPDEVWLETPKLWEALCHRLELKHFFGPDMQFNKGEFFGARSEYFTLAYFPLKILQWIGKIVYHGKRVRILSDEEAAVWKAEKRRWEAERCCPEDSLQSPEKAK